MKFNELRWVKHREYALERVSTNITRPGYMSRAKYGCGWFVRDNKDGTYDFVHTNYGSHEDDHSGVSLFELAALLAPCRHFPPRRKKP